MSVSPPARTRLPIGVKPAIEMTLATAGDAPEAWSPAKQELGGLFPGCYFPAWWGAPGLPRPLHPSPCLHPITPSTRRDKLEAWCHPGETHRAQQPCIPKTGAHGWRGGMLFSASKSSLEPGAGWLRSSRGCCGLDVLTHQKKKMGARFPGP